uniref:MHD1 domain-containing protein n=1 Tax=Manihot esculenta TaxID=3983 RepID=A0A2C9UDY2_MANES
MAQHTTRDSFSGPILYGPSATAIDPAEADLTWPFGDLVSLDREDIRETAYEVFYTACRSSPGFGGGRNAITFYSNHHHLHDAVDSGGSGSTSGSGSVSSNGGRVGGGSVVVTTPTSKIKRALGLKMLKRSPSRRMSSGASGGGGGGGVVGSTPGSPCSSTPSNHSGGYSPFSTLQTVPMSRPRRPLTSAEIMRLQMRVTEQSDNRLRKTLMRTLVGQVGGRKAETIILPLELLRHLKPLEFGDTHEYHLWQRRQLKILEAGILLHPTIPLEKSNSYAMRLREIIRSSDTKPIDTSKNSDTMRTLCNCVVTLSWRSPTGAPSDVCHWADGFPLNLHMYTCLLQAIFDFRDETLVLDEVDELVELMKKTWSTLGINRPIHNLCFTWVLFQQYVLTSQTEPDLLYAAHAMLSTEVANDAKKPDREAIYVKLLSSMLASMQGWAERRLLHYHDYFQRGNIFLIENLLPLALSASKILGEDVTLIEGTGKEDWKIVDSSGDRVDHYIRASIKNAFARIIETGSYKRTCVEVKDEASEALLQLAKETEDLALRERESFSPILKKWQPIAASVGAVTLHQCYGVVLKQYLAGMSSLNCESVEVLQRAAKLERFLVQMVVGDSADCEDGGKSIVREMIPYEVDAVIMRVMKQWVDERMKKGKECFVRAKDTETWNPKSKSEPYAQSAVELMKFAKETVEEFFETPVGITDDLVSELAEGLEHLFLKYIKFVEACVFPQKKCSEKE